MVVESTARLRVRFAETDATQVVYYGQYFVWFEVARTELFRSIGLPYSKIREKGLHTPVVRASAQYKAPARYDDQIEVRAKVSAVGGSSFTLDYVVKKSRRGPVLSTGQTVHVFVGEDGKAKRIPQEFRERLGAV